MKRLTEEIPTHPKAFGEALRQLREAASVSLDELVSETKISRRILESLENGKFHYLPEKVFSRNFVQQYARFVCQDERPYVQAFDIAWDRFELASGTHPQPLVDETPKKIIRWHFWAPILLTIVLFFVVSLVILQGPRDEAEILPLETRRSHLSQTVMSPVAAMTPSIGGLGTQVQDSEESIVKMVVQVEQGQECWIKYRDRDGRVGQEIVQGDDRALELRGPILLTLGNAGVVKLRVGEQEYQDLGRPGQVVHTEVSLDGLLRFGKEVSR